MTAYADERTTDGLTHLQAVALAAGSGASLLYTKNEVVTAVNAHRRVYALTAGHTQVIRLRVPEDINKQEWAGYWVGTATLPVGRK
jgi:hypothetical protein